MPEPVGMKICKVENCGRGVNETKGAFGYCGKHYMRVKRYGDPHYVTTEDRRRVLSREAQPKLGKCKPTTYKKLLGRHEHRVIAEQILGRKLSRHEHVHHIDGNRHNNDPKNLAVLTEIEHAKIHNAERVLANRKRNRFNDDQIREIRKIQNSHKTAALKFGVSAALIRDIKLKKIYKHVTDS